MPANTIDNTWVTLLSGLYLSPCDTALGHLVPGGGMPRSRRGKRCLTVAARTGIALAGAHDQHGHVQMMPHRTDGGAEDQVLQSAVTVRAHDHQIGPDLPGITQDFLRGRDRMRDLGHHANPLIAQGLGDPFEVYLAQLDFRPGGRTED